MRSLGDRAILHRPFWGLTSHARPAMADEWIEVVFDAEDDLQDISNAVALEAEEWPSIAMSGTTIDEEVLGAIAHAIEVNPAIRSLSLGGTLASNTWIAGAAARSATLTSLSLRKSDLRGRDILKMCEALETNNALTSLHFGKNQLGADAGAALAKVLGRNSVLTKLKISENQLGAAGSTALSTALAFNSTLTLLSLNCT